jgi:hypothetical protein
MLTFELDTAADGDLDVVESREGRMRSGDVVTDKIMVSMP